MEHTHALRVSITVASGVSKQESASVRRTRRGRRRDLGEEAGGDGLGSKRN